MLFQALNPMKMLLKLVKIAPLENPRDTLTYPLSEKPFEILDSVYRFLLRYVENLMSELEG